MLFGDDTKGETEDLFQSSVTDEFAASNEDNGLFSSDVSKPKAPSEIIC